MVLHSETSYERPLSVVVPYFCLHLFTFLSLSCVPTLDSCPSSLS